MAAAVFLRTAGTAYPVIVFEPRPSAEELHLVPDRFLTQKELFPARNLINCYTF